MPYDRILVATDESKLSRKAVKAAIQLAASTGAQLVALHVVPRYPTAFFEGGMAMEPEDVGRVERQWAEKGRAVVDAVALAADQAGVRAKAVVAQSDEVADAILATARKQKCDLIVMASHGRRGLQRILLGSETQHVLTRGEMPVLVVR